MIIIVDTNIVFSAILNTKSIIGDLILNSNKVFQYWGCHYLLMEIDKHWDKIKKISKLDNSELLESQRLVFKNISFINEGQIPNIHRLRAYDLVKDIDLNDIVFVALNEYQESLLWTGDKALIQGLKSLGYNRLITTEEMVKLRKRLENKIQ
jgi:predicted nucleic acid-binding protein